MLKGTVCAVAGHSLSVRVDRATCAACLDGRGCGMGLLAGDASRYRIIDVPCAGALPAVGDIVTLSQPPRLVEAALIAYGVPLAGLLAGAALGERWFSGPASAGVAVAIMFAAGFAARRLAARRYGGDAFAVSLVT